MINRRDFIRTSVLAGGALFAQTAIPSGAADFLHGHGGSARPVACDRSPGEGGEGGGVAPLNKGLSPSGDWGLRWEGPSGPHRSNT